MSLCAITNVDRTWPGEDARRAGAGSTDSGLSHADHRRRIRGASRLDHRSCAVRVRYPSIWLSAFANEAGPRRRNQRVRLGPWISR
jgi:hypothetical protein